MKHESDGPARQTQPEEEPAPGRPDREEALAGSELFAQARACLAAGDTATAVASLEILLRGIAGDAELKQMGLLFQQIYRQQGDSAAGDQCAAILSRALWERFVAATHAGDLAALARLLGDEENISLLFSQNGLPSEVTLTQGMAVFSRELDRRLDELFATSFAEQARQQDRRRLYTENLRLLEEHCHPSTVNALRELAGHLPESGLTACGLGFFEKKTTWRWHLPQTALLTQSNWARESRERYLVNCPSPGIFGALLRVRSPKHPFLLKGCRYILIDFGLLFNLLHACSLAPLFDGTHACNFLDSGDLPRSWRRLFIGSNLWLPQKILLSTPELSKTIQELCDETEALLLAETRKAEQRLAEYDKNFVFPARQPAQAANTRVLLITCRHTTFLQYSTRDMARGFEELGCETLLLKEERWDGEGLRHDVMQTTLASFQPHLVFCIDHFRHELHNFPARIPFVTWIQDILPHMWKMTDPQLLGPHDYLFTFSVSLRCGLQAEKNGLGHLPCFRDQTIHLLPVPVNTSIYHPLAGTGKKYDIISVTHLPLPEETLEPLRRGKKLPGLDDKAVTFLEAVALAMDALPTATLWEIKQEAPKEKFAQEVCARAGLQFERAFLQLLSTQTHSRFFLDLFRQIKSKPIRFLLANGIDVRVFGNNWDKYEGFAAAAMGPVENGAPLNRLINEARINLSSSGTTFHVKMAEVMGAGGFLLGRLVHNDPQPLPDGFEEGRELVLFTDEEDLLRKVRHYLSHEEERQRIAEEGCQRIMESSSVAARARQVLEVVAAGEAVTAGDSPSARKNQAG